jgi:hypothetical protein
MEARMTEDGITWMALPAQWDFQMSPKKRWKAQHSAARWQRRYGTPKVLLTGYIGTYDGFRIIRSTP